VLLIDYRQKGTLLMKPSKLFLGVALLTVSSVLGGETLTPRLFPQNPADIPQRFFVFETPPGLSRQQAEKRWSASFAKWSQTAVVSISNTTGNAVSGGGFGQSFIPHCSAIKAVVVQCYPVSRSGGWFRLDLCEDENGLPAKFVLARTWLRIDPSCPVPYAGFMVFDLGDVQVAATKHYWILLTEHRDDKKTIDVITNGIAGSKYSEGTFLVGKFSPTNSGRNFQIISKCDPCSGIRPATETEKASLPDFNIIGFDWKTSRDGEPITWEEIVDLLNRGQECELIHLKQRFNLETLTQEQKDFLKANVKGCRVRPGYRFIVCECEWAILVRLHDEETLQFLLTQFPKGGGAASDAASVFASAAQPWVIPLLEKYVFWDPKNDKRVYTECIIYETISQTALGTCSQIIKRSPAFCAKIKDWFELVMSLSWKNRNEQSTIIREWWNLNRQAMQDGRFSDLQTVNLWKSTTDAQTAKSRAYNKDDYIDALFSPYGMVRQLAARKLAGDYRPQLGPRDVPRLAAAFQNPNGELRDAMADLLGKLGPEGRNILEKSFQQTDAALRRSAAAHLLLSSPSISDEKRAFYLKEIKDDFGYLTAVLAPADVVARIKEVVLDTSRTDKDRTHAASVLMNYAKVVDPLFVESLLAPEFPAGVRGQALLVAGFYTYPTNVPPAVLKMRLDPDAWIRSRVYECMRAHWQDSYWDLFVDGLQDNSPMVAKECACDLANSGGKRSIPLLVEFLKTAVTRDATWEEARIAVCERIAAVADLSKMSSQPDYPKPTQQPKEFSLLWAKNIFSWWDAGASSEFAK
jgi:hypothetical protein